MVFPFVGPLLIIIFCYVSIMCMIRKRMTQSNLEETVGTRRNVNLLMLAQRNTVFTLLIVVICYVICWTPSQVIYFLYNFGYNIDFNSTYNHASVLMVFLNCTVNPFVYLIKYKEYQKALKNCIQCNTETERQNRFFTVSAQVQNGSSLE